jgi:hypothetical protein
LAYVRPLINPPRNSPHIEATDSLLVAELTPYDFQGWLPKEACYDTAPPEKLNADFQTA